MTEPTQRDREVSEAARNSGSRAERDGIIAAYREECEQRDETLESSLFEAQKLCAVLEDLESRYCIESDYASDQHPVLEAVMRMQATAMSRAERAESKLAAIRKLVTYDKPLQGERPGAPRFVVKGCEVLKVLDEEDV